MKLRRVNAKERKRDRLGAAVEYELALDTMGGSLGDGDVSVYLGRSHIVELFDVLDGSALRERLKIADQLWADLMATVERLVGEFGDMDLEGVGDTARVAGTPEDWLLFGEERGKAQGIAFALALLENPVHPDIDAIRAESVARWEALQEE